MVILINGIPGSGKTTTADQVARRLERAAHIEGDALQELIKSGRVSPGELPTDEQDRQIDLCVAHQCLLSNSFQRQGFAVVVDYVITNQDRLRQYRRALEGDEVYLVTLDPGSDEALVRDARRAKHVASRWTHLEDEMRATLGQTGLWIASRTLTVSEVVDTLFEHLDEARLPPTR